MVSVGISGMGSYVPPKVLTNDDIAKIVDTSDEWITSRIGIKERRVVEGDVCTSDLAVLASERALEDAGIKAEDVDMIVLATSSPDVPMSSTAGILQGKLGAVNAGAFDLAAVCTGYVYALDVGAKYAADPNYENVLVVGAEVYSKILNWEDRTTCVFFGDGAGAAVVSECDEGKGILASYLKADGRGAEGGPGEVREDPGRRGHGDQPPVQHKHHLHGDGGPGAAHGEDLHQPPEVREHGRGVYTRSAP
jgi:3-oxoacyl-[acyl-carrier-protein] synthase-3